MAQDNETNIPAPSANQAEGSGDAKQDQKLKQKSAAEELRDAHKRIEEIQKAKNAKKAAAKKAATQIDQKIAVVATAKCFYRNTRWKKGEKFTIKRPEHFSAECMELVK